MYGLSIMDYLHLFDLGEVHNLCLHALNSFAVLKKTDNISSSLHVSEAVVFEN